MRETARQERGLHADGQPGNGRPRLPPRRRAGAVGRHRRGPRGPRLDQSSVQVLEASARHRRSPHGESRCPKHVHWDLFLGPAPERPYNPVYHPHNWRGWWDFGTGSLGDMACHTANLTFMAPRARPARPGVGEERRDQLRDLSGLGDDHLRVSRPAATCRRSSSPGTRGRRTASATCRRTGLFPDSGFQPSDSGSLLIGSKWRMYSPNDYGAVQMLWPVGEYTRHQGPRAHACLASRVPAASTTARSWNGSQAIRAGKPSLALSNFDYASTLTESMLLGNVAVRSGQAIDYNPETGEIAGSSSAVAVSQALFPQGLGDLKRWRASLRRFRNSSNATARGRLLQCWGKVGGVGSLRRTFSLFASMARCLRIRSKPGIRVLARARSACGLYCGFHDEIHHHRSDGARRARPPRGGSRMCRPLAPRNGLYGVTRLGVIDGRVRPIHDADWPQ